MTGGEGEKLGVKGGGREKIMKEGEEGGRMTEEGQRESYRTSRRHSIQMTATDRSGDLEEE